MNINNIRLKPKMNILKFKPEKKQLSSELNYRVVIIIIIIIFVLGIISILLVYFLK